MTGWRGQSKSAWEIPTREHVRAMLLLEWLAILNRVPLAAFAARLAELRRGR